MDWHKLQKTLFELDPVDPKEDLAKLKGSVQNQSMPINESVDYVRETYAVPDGSLPTDKNYSLSEFAALAGITITESKQKDGDYARGGGPMPKAKAGRTKHPLKNKLVGEGPMDAIKQGVQKGLDSPNWAQDKIQKGLGISRTSNPEPEKKAAKKSRIQPQRLARLIPVENPQHFLSALRKSQQPGEQALTRNEITALADGFTQLLKMDPRDTVKVMQALRQMQTPQEESVEYESIKERLYRELNNKKL